jgi:hypothetical protein
MKVKETFNVPPWNDERVKRCHWVSVTYRIRESIGTDWCRYDLAETASLFSVVVAFSDFSKVGVIPSGSVCTAFQAEGLEVLKLVGPTVFPGQNVLDFQSTFICRDSTELTVKSRAFEHRVAELAGNG